MDEHLFALSLFILLVLLAKNHRMLLLMVVRSFNMLRRRIQHTNGMLWQYFFRVQNESLQLHRTAWVHPSTIEHGGTGKFSILWLCWPSRMHIYGSVDPLQ